MSKKKRQEKETKGVVLNSFQELSRRVQTPTPTPPPASKPAVQPKPKPVATTVAGKNEYDSFFALYHLWVTGEAKGEFIPLGFIPGPAVITATGRVLAATPDLRLKPGDGLPAKVQVAAEEWRRLVQGLGYQPSPWNAGFARRLLGGKPPAWLAMAMPRFRYRPGDAEVPFGVVLLPTEGPGERGMLVSRVYNPVYQPRGVADCPAVSEFLSLAVLKDGRGPVQKLLRTWALMEANYASRCPRQAPKPPAA